MMITKTRNGGKEFGNQIGAYTEARTTGMFASLSGTITYQPFGSDILVSNSKRMSLCIMIAAPLALSENLE